MNELETLRAELAAAKEEAAELQDIFDLQWEADMRAVGRWREANPGNELVLPDRANLVVWLLGLVERSAAHPGSREGERCFCGEPAAHKVEEVVFADDPQPVRHPLTSYVCREHFREIMGPTAS
ncbi:hypothetical protein NLM33_13520 [Bradyrhizobium sp. CCGUVB1N3]|uniref:hypothetical protein n=1 Tax=Bradyrhizobium sp. CCGUVB1N3 TaxID=2949629 RepID=UPI0020B297A2|nr:hypothetical protein [Bradyrhizobium sp. CCGUVB1N3]MCP3471351.1 hypothetical protein [Bradyrhizobium sp. CCGUVB1N3]